MAPKKPKKKYSIRVTCFLPFNNEKWQNYEPSNKSQVENEGGCMRPYKFTHATFLSLLEK